MLLTKSKYLILAGVAAISLSLAGCDDAKNDNSSTNGSGGTASNQLDTDGDGIPDKAPDNCPLLVNANQSDLDLDGIGDICDSDTDGDGASNTIDNCPIVSNADQKDTDKDGIGDACEGDRDGDGINDTTDNCPSIANNPNTDTDRNGVGDACQDSDNDTVIDSKDNCPLIGNTDQKDQDRDSKGDLCDTDLDGDGPPNGSDNCPLIANDQKDTNGDGIGDACETDSDGDGALNTTDNCRFDANANQKDTDNDGLGDACDDSDSDGVKDFKDNCPTIANNQTDNMDGDDKGDVCDDNIDGDSFSNSIDKCRLVNSSSNTDSDGDGIGDACDNDRDNDTVADTVDNCPLVFNPKQEDFNKSATPGATNSGDACEDSDNDTFLDRDDNCPLVNSLNRNDQDGDGKGDVCDDNIDGDNKLNADDNCPLISNPDQLDADHDGKGDKCDIDQDGDGVTDAQGDNCPLAPNQSQLDGDKDDVGDACDTNGFTCGAGTAYGACPTSTDLKTSFTCSSFAPTGSIATPVKEGGLCSLSNVLLNGSILDICGVDTPASAADGNGNTFAKVNNAVALADSLFTDGALTGSVGVTVTLPQRVAAGKLAAFKISVPRSLFELSLAKAITVTTDGGDSFGGANQTGGLALELLAAGYDGNVDQFGIDNLALGATQPQYVLGGYATAPFQTITIKVGAGLSVDLGTSLEVYDVCTDIRAGTAAPVGDGTSPLPILGAGGTTPVNNNPLGFITTPLGNALAPVTGALGAVTTPLSDALDGALGSTPLAPISNGVVDLLDGTGTTPPPSDIPSIPTSLDEVLALLPENPLTRLLVTLMDMIPGGGAGGPTALQELLTNNQLTQALTDAAAGFPFNPFG